MPNIKDTTQTALRKWHDGVKWINVHSANWKKKGPITYLLLGCKEVKTNTLQHLQSNP